MGDWGHFSRRGCANDKLSASLGTGDLGCNCAEIVNMTPDCGSLDCGAADCSSLDCSGADCSFLDCGSCGS